MNDKPTVIEEFADRATFTAVSTVLSTRLVDSMSDANPTSGEYRRLMDKMGL